MGAIKIGGLGDERNGAAALDGLEQRRGAPAEAEDAGEKCAYVQIPTENAEDFISAIDQLGTVSDSSYLNASTEKTVEICVRLVAEWAKLSI